MADVNLVFSVPKTTSDPKERGCLIIGNPASLSQVSFDNFSEKLQPRVDSATFNAVIKSLTPSDFCPVWLGQVVLCALPSNSSRHNSPHQTHVLTSLVLSNLPYGDSCIVVVCERSAVFASACAVARCFPLFSLKTNNKTKRTVTVEFLVVGKDATPLTEDDVSCLTAAAESVRLAAKIVDIPCNDMNTDHFLEEIKAVGKELGITPVIIRGEELKERGFGGIYGVGKAAANPPALAVLSHTPAGATRSIAWCGKGIVYDTGGLSIKTKVGT
ncbi:predicted protein [Nematostella vectensis]|uniref:Uncharacterized protein n=1 Tax=Nematostella vectensis TaxID=45351 RepID=A7S3X4_NEMVE|nr:predicted protein [Nematostella vectensis]|eukprot:XP_001633677.1 predicted protein [Nematostella vectensis]